MQPESWAEFLEVDRQRPWAPRRDPWRARHRGVFEVPRRLLLQAADPEQVRQAAKHTERLRVIRDGWLCDGILDPLTVVVDSHGRVALKDGYHRLVVSEAMFDRLPVRLVMSERLRMPSVPVAAILPALVAELTGA